MSFPKFPYCSEFYHKLFELTRIRRTPRPGCEHPRCSSCPSDLPVLSSSTMRRSTLQFLNRRGQQHLAARRELRASYCTSFALDQFPQLDRQAPIAADGQRYQFILAKQCGAGDTTRLCASPCGGQTSRMGSLESCYSLLLLHALPR